MDPLVSFVAVTEGRSEWMPWLWWNWQRQTYENREMILVHARISEESLEPFRKDPRVTLVQGTHGTFCGYKRNEAIPHMKGEWVCWWDDDDWYSPSRTTKLVEASKEAPVGTELLGWDSCYWADLKTEQRTRYISGGFVVPVLALVRAKRVREHQMRRDDWVADGTWIQEFYNSSKNAVTLPDTGYCHSLWFAHHRNTPRRYRWSEVLPTMRELAGDEWGDTDEQLQALRARILDWPEDTAPSVSHTG